MAVPSQSDLQIETGIGFVNFSKQFYVTFRVRDHAADPARTPFFLSSLLAPGAHQRVRMLYVLGTGCGIHSTCRCWVYRRVNDSVPIGLDPGEAVIATPLAAGQITQIPACNVQPLETYTIVNFDASAGTARVKFCAGHAGGYRYSRRGIVSERGRRLGGLGRRFIGRPALPPTARADRADHRAGHGHQWPGIPERRRAAAAPFSRARG